MAIDLRVMELIFRQKLADRMPELILHHFSDAQPKREWALKLCRTILPVIYRRLEQTSSMDSGPRFLDAFSLTVQPILESGHQLQLQPITSWKLYAATEAQKIYVESRDGFFLDVEQAYNAEDSEIRVGPAEQMLGIKNRAMYRFVRKELGILPRRGDVKLGAHHGQFHFICCFV